MFSNNKKILINGSILSEKPTGVGVYSFNVLNKMQNEGVSADIFSSFDFNLNTNNNKTIKTTKYTRPHPYKKLAGAMRFMVNQTQLSVLGLKYDLVYSPTSHGSFFLNNQIITVHDLISLHFPNQYKLQYYYFKYFMPILLKKAKKVIAISQSTKNDLLKFYDLTEDKIKVIYNGFNPQKFQYKENAKDFIYKKYGLNDFLLTVGSSYPHKNISRLIEAYISLPNDIVNKYKLVITGYPSKYQQNLLYKYCDYSKNIFFLGYVENKDLAYLYSASELFVYPSLYEGFGFPPLEAMSCECPVVVSNLSSLPEVCGEAAEYINPYDSKSIAKGIQNVFYDKNYRELLVKKGIKQVQKFNWEKTVQQIANLLGIVKNDTN